MLALYLTALAYLSPAAPQTEPALQGIVQGALPGEAAVWVRAYRLQQLQAERPKRLSKFEFYHRKPDAQVRAAKGRFAFEGLATGAYALVAFQDLDGNGQLDYAPPEPLGWYAAASGGWLDPVEVGKLKAPVTIRLRRTTPFPTARKTRSEATGDGELGRLQGLTVLRLRGTPRQRGLAHGYLIAQQILEFFEFYVLEDKFKSAALYERTFARFLETNFRYPKDYLEEVDAVLEGMQRSGVKLHVPWLGRDFSRTDLLAINAYIETRAMRSSCTQFAVWGAQTKGSDVDGGTIAARNMDGEIDLRKVTVSHFLAIAVDQRDESKQRYINLMWPGFVGTITGVNEAGFYAMENAGGTGPGPVVDQLVPISWTQRLTLEHCGAEATPKQVEAILDASKSSGGGSCGPGCIILFATPYRGQTAPAFVYEGDRFGGAMRLPGEVRPLGPQHIMASNHHRKYGVKAADPGKYFGRTPSFSSRWRYEAGMHLLESWTRQGRPVGTAEMKRLLQTVAHGTTEHSIIFDCNRMLLHVAVDDLKADMWDAPYQPFKQIHFEAFFSK